MGELSNEMRQALGDRLAQAAEHNAKNTDTGAQGGAGSPAAASGPAGGRLLPGGLDPDNNNEHKRFIRACYERNQVGDAALYNRMFIGQRCFVAEWEKFLTWAGHHWRVDMLNKQALTDMERICEAYKKVEADVTDGDGDPKLSSKLTNAFSSRLKALRSAAGRRNVLECSTTIEDAPVITAKDDLDKQDYLLATPNGVADLRGGFGPGRPEQYILRACPTPWPEGVDLSKPIDELAPRFTEYLTSCMADDREMVEFIVRLLGYGLLGKKSLHVWAIFYGPLSRNGKDTLMNVLRYVLGELHVNFNVSMLTEKKIERDSSAPQVDMMALRGTRIAYCSEANSRQVLNQARIKELTGGGFITARGNQDKEMTTWQQSALLILLTNYLPKIDASDDGFRARTICVEWPTKFVENPNPARPYERKLVDRMDERLKEEASGILACLVKGAQDVLTGGLRIPDKVLQYTKDRIADFDDIGKFLAECCEVEEPPTGGRNWETETQGSDFIKVLNWWCKTVLGNAYPYTPKKVTPSLEKKGIPSHKSSVMYYKGVTIKAEVLNEYERDQDGGYNGR